MRITIQKRNTVTITVADVSDPKEAGILTEDAIRRFLGFMESHPEFTTIAIY